ncbi:MAG: choice-of-anchor D domain-containing protein [Ignavibacteria bacterium]|nr:choice-of-anchor D domain-containing protein [Ignavibacteria bacterium]
MKRKISFLLLLIFTFYSQIAFAQQFNLYSIDTTNFPLMSALFYAKTQAGIDYPNPQPNDFDFFENGVRLNHTLVVDCKKVNFFPQLAVALVLDVSTSMNADAGNGERRIDWVKQGAFAFLDSIKLDPPSVIGIVLFAGDVYKTSPLYEKKQDLYDWLNINLLVASGATDFYPPFVKEWPPLGAIPLLESAPKDLRRVIIFLTDGYPERPFTRAKVDTVIARAKRAKAQVYSLFITTPTNPDIDRVCQNTGGRSFEINSKSALISAFKQIVGEIQSRNICYLQWVAPFGCDQSSRKRNIKAIFKRIPDSVITDYTAPTTSIAKLIFSDSLLLFGAPGIGTTIRSLSLTAQNTDFTINSFSLPSTKFSIDWNGKTLPFILSKDQTHTINIRYTETTPAASEQTIFQINSSPCQPDPITLVAPCGGEVVKEINFSKVPVQNVKTQTETCIFKNTTAVPLEFTLSIEGSDPTEFSLVDGTGPFLLNPGECLSLRVQFKPHSIGNKTAILKFNIPSYCGTFSTNLKGEGIPSALPLPPVEFNVRRILTVTDTLISITNSTPAPLTIQSISLQNIPDDNFSVTPQTSLPTTLNQNESIQVRIRFNPQIEGYLENQIQVGIQNFPTQPSFQVSGIGGLPKIQAEDVDFGPVQVGTKSTLNLIIINPSTSMDLYITEVLLGPTSEFKFAGGAITSNFIVPKNHGSVAIPIEFTPNVPGIRRVSAIIKNDAAPGPNNKPIVNDTVIIHGLGLGVLAYPDTLDFGEVSICQLKDLIIEIDNSQMNIEQQVLEVNVLGSNAADFQILNYPQKIKPGEKGNVVVRLAPANVNQALNAIISIKTTFGEKQITLIGKAFSEKVQITYQMNQSKFQVSKNLTISFITKVQKNHSVNLSSIQLNLQVPFKNLKLISFTSELPGWNWTTQKTNFGYVINGNGPNITTPLNFTSSMTFETYLSDIHNPEIILTAEFPEARQCLVPEPKSQVVNLVTCFTEGRLVEVSDKNYKLYEIVPNPASGNLEIEVELAFDGNLKLEIYNYLGQPIAEIFDGETRKGNYKFPINTMEFPNGLYFIRMSSGTIAITRSFIIRN